MTSRAQLAEQTHLIPLPVGHLARKAKVVWPLAMYGNVGTSLSEETAKSLAVLTGPDPCIASARVLADTKHIR